VLTGSESTSHDSEDVGVIQPFHSFVLSLTMILVSEVGDKTFLVAALMAMKHDRMVVFSAAFGALLVMTVLSAVLGHAVPALIPKKITSFLAAGLFFVFGAKLLREGMEMDPNEGVTAEMHEVEQELAEKEKELGRHQRNGNGVSPYALEMGLEGRHSRSKSRISTPPRSPSESPQRHSPDGSSLTNMIQGAGNLCSLLLSPAWVQTFIMTFLGEWGDRSQIATIAMAAGQDYWWVTLGAMVGHCICTGVAVIGGRAIAGRVSLKVGKSQSSRCPDILSRPLTLVQSLSVARLPSSCLASSTSSRRSTRRVKASWLSLTDRWVGASRAQCRHVSLNTA
jgi:putative Ca2+/H+ antiporter (TMEM165/GDT1 family)